MKKIFVYSVLSVFLFTLSFASVYAEPQIPELIKNNVNWWAAGQIDDQAFVSGIEFLISEGTINVPITQKSVSETDEIPPWVRTNAEWWADGIITDNDFVAGIEFLVNSGIIQVKQTSQSQIDPPSLEIDAGPTYDSIELVQETWLCSGNARCFTGIVTQVIDGDTIKVDGKSIRFSMASAPELNEIGGIEAREFIETICPVGSVATVDEDDGQTQGSYGRILAVIYCNGFNLNQDLLDVGHGYLISDFCKYSEFENDYWAQKHGCAEPDCPASHPYLWSDGMCYNVPEPVYDKPKESAPVPDCDPSYPDFCIPPPPPDLDCKDIPQKNFTVLQPDPHRFDGDKDGIGCES